MDTLRVPLTVVERFTAHFP